MASRKRTAQPKSSPVRTGSWMALLAATTLGLDGADTVRAEVRADERLAASRDYRLVVQSYDGDASAIRARPVASYQRAITADELRSGVRVSLLELRSGERRSDSGAHVIAWVEQGKPDLEFDGRMARPRKGSIVGVARRHGADSVQIRLSRNAA